MHFFGQRMNRFLVILKRPLLAMLLFMIFQVAATFLALILQAFSGDGSVLDNISQGEFDAQLAGIASLVTNVLMAGTCLWLFRRGIYTQSRHKPSSTPWKRSVMALLGCIVGTMSLNLLAELLALPNVMEEQMLAMCQDPWGIAAIALGAPLGEEIVFRWGIMGHMLRRNCTVAVSVMVSAALFGVLHVNPAQVFFASAMGVMLGILYWKSGNIFWPILLHILNNSVACLLVWIMGTEAKDFSMADFIGGNTVAWSAAGILAALCTGILWWYAIGGKKQTEQQQTL